MISLAQLQRMQNSKVLDGPDERKRRIVYEVTAGVRSVWDSLLVKIRRNQIEREYPFDIVQNFSVWWERFPPAVLGKGVTVVYKLWDPNCTVLSEDSAWPIYRGDGGYLTIVETRLPDLPYGVRKSPIGKFIAQRGGRYLGVYETKEQAHQQWIRSYIDFYKTLEADYLDRLDTVTAARWAEIRQHFECLSRTGSEFEAIPPSKLDRDKLKEEFFNRSSFNNQ